MISAGELTPTLIHCWPSQKHLQVCIPSGFQSSLGHGTQSPCFKVQPFSDCLEMSPEARCVHTRVDGRDVNAV